MPRFLMRFFLAALLLVLGLPNGSVQAAEFTFSPEYDTTIKRSAPTSSFGGDTTVSVLYEGGTGPDNTPVEVHEALLKFDLSGLPSSQVIESATLSLTGGEAPKFRYGDIRFRRIIDAWNEATTWETRPRTVTESVVNVEVENNAFPAALDITSVVRGWQSGQYANHGLLVRAYGDGDYATGYYTGDAASIASRESSSAPRLIIRTAPQSGAQSSPSPKMVTSSPSPSATVPTSPTPSVVAIPSPSPSVSISPIVQNTVTPTPSPLIILPDWQKVGTCASIISSLEVSRAGTQASIRVRLTKALNGTLYLYQESRVPAGASDGLAHGFTANSQRETRSTPETSHEWPLKDLDPSKTYYYTLVFDQTQECEHSFSLFSLIEGGKGPSILSGASKGLDSTQEGNGGTGKNLQASLGAFGSAVVGIGEGVSTVLFGKTGAKKESLASSGIGLFILAVLSQGFGRRWIRFLGVWLNLANVRYAIWHPVKKGSTWGKVMSSVTLRGVPFARITLKHAKTKEVVAETTSDEHGFYGFSASAGSYEASVRHGVYTFPSRIMPFGYRGEVVRVEGQNTPVQLDIPMDPSEMTNPWLQKWETRLDQAGYIRVPLLLFGLGLLLIGLQQGSVAFDALAGLLYVWLFWREWKTFQYAKYRVTLMASDGNPIPYALVQIKNSGGHMFDRVVTTDRGQCTVRVPQGTYQFHVVLFGEGTIAHSLTLKDIALRHSFGLRRITLTVPASASS